MSKENNLKYIVLHNDEQGVVKIADDVLTVIIGYAAVETEGIASIAGNVNASILNKVGMKVLSKGIHVRAIDGVFTVNVAVVIKYGYSIPEVCENVQSRIKSSIEDMTGITVGDVNIMVSGVKAEE